MRSLRLLLWLLLEFLVLLVLFFPILLFLLSVLHS